MSRLAGAVVGHHRTAVDTADTAVRTVADTAVDTDSQNPEAGHPRPAPPSFLAAGHTVLLAACRALLRASCPAGILEAAHPVLPQIPLRTLGVQNSLQVRAVVGGPSGRTAVVGFARMTRSTCASSPRHLGR